MLMRENLVHIVPVGVLRTAHPIAHPIGSNITYVNPVNAACRGL